jgi:hypothetical protein
MTGTMRQKMLAFWDVRREFPVLTKNPFAKAGKIWFFD